MQAERLRAIVAAGDHMPLFLRVWRVPRRFTRASPVRLPGWSQREREKPESERVLVSSAPYIAIVPWGQRSSLVEQGEPR